MDPQERKIHTEKVQQFENVEIKDQLMTVNLTQNRKAKGNFMKRLKKENEIVHELEKNGVDLNDYLKNKK